MKTLYKINKKSLTWAGVLAGLLFASSCTKDFEKYNTNPNAATEDQLKGDFQNIGAFFPDMETSIMRTVNWEYQVQQNLNADVYSGYMMSGSPYLGNVNNLNYAMVPSWNTYPFDEAYQHVMANWLQIKNRAEKDYSHLYAVATIIKVEGMHRVTDIYGPIPYSKFGTSAFSIPYDDQATVYNTFFSELDNAITTLTNYVKANPGATPFAKFDLIYGGDYTKWIRFANTLRLRLAMRIAYANPTLAKTQAEAAATNTYGLLADGEGAFVNMVNGVTYQNPLWSISNSWGDILMGAPMESILKGYNDPRLAVYFSLSTTPVANDHKGIRNGIAITAGQYAGFSHLNNQPTDPIQLMVPSEGYFLKAEGALRGWNMGGGTAQSYYEAGVKASFAEKGVSGSDTYLANATSTAAPYVDPVNAANSVAAGSPYLNNVTIKYNAGDAMETNLQRIITQKWIATYPDGQEAWSEFRRTGYPKLFPVVVNNSGGTISTTGFIRRLPFPSSELSTNSAEVQKAVTLLGGPDNGGTKLWWDKK